MQTITNTLVAVIWRRIESTSTSDVSCQDKSSRTLHHPLLLLTSSTYVFAMVASNESLRFVSYPTAVLAKSCKMIPTMVMGSFIEKRNYSLQQWTSALCISVGIAVFNLSRIKDLSDDNDNDEDDSKQDQYWKGMILLFFSLCMDGFLGSFQGMLKREDKTRRRRPPTAVETMLFVNVYALLFMIPMAIVSGQWSQGIEILKDDPSLLYAVAILTGVVSIGQIFIFLTITWYSSLVCTTITTTRKFFTILFSVLHFGHKFSVGQWTSVCMVFGGLYLSIASNGRHPSTPAKSDKQD
jgi:UDP-galactose transporter B1